MLKIILGCMILVMLIYLIFFSTSTSEKWDLDSSSSFECGYTSYFFSRFSFSIHYFLVGMIFLFLDLEVSLVLPYFMGHFDSNNLMNMILFFILVLTVGLLYEWNQGQLEWKF